MDNEKRGKEKREKKSVHTHTQTHMHTQSPQMKEMVQSVGIKRPFQLSHVSVRHAIITFNVFPSRERSFFKG